ncbi:hypothetical protein AgCh_022072 [Apium graveolens]
MLSADEEDEGIVVSDAENIEESEDPSMVPLSNADIWVQVYDIPRGLMSENILKNVGAAIGGFIKSDPANYDGYWKQFAQIRVSFDTEKPLKRRMKIKKEVNDGSWINFKYERLSTFCFVCERIGHSERDCNVVYANPDKIVDRAYGVWLRAPAKNADMNAGSRWLRNIADENKKWTSKSTSSEHSNTDHGRSGGQRDAKFIEIDGVVREFGADNSALTIKGRKNGDIDMEEKFKKQLEGFEGVDSGLNEVIAFNSKRKLVKENVREKKMEDNNMINLDNEQGHGGGLALFWKHAGGVVIIYSTQNYIDFEVMNEQVGKWRYTGFYGCPERSRRYESWKVLKGLKHKSLLPWCIIGDFNDMINVSEKRGGRRQPRYLMEGFKQTIEECGLVDLGFKSEAFTWERARGIERWVWKRLDRGMANVDWLELFPSAVVKVLEVSSSDHPPLYLMLNRQVYVPNVGPTPGPLWPTASKTTFQSS